MTIHKLKPVPTDRQGAAAPGAPRPRAHPDMAEWWDANAPHIKEALSRHRMEIAMRECRDYDDMPRFANIRDALNDPAPNWLDRALIRLVWIVFAAGVGMLAWLLIGF